MRIVQRNKRPIWYALYNKITDEMDAEGNYTGEKVTTYDEPVKDMMNVSGGRGSAEVEIFGVDNPFTRSVVTNDLTTPFNTDTIWWFESEPYDALGNRQPHNYRCTGVARTMNQAVIALAEVDVNDVPQIASY